MQADEVGLEQHSNSMEERSSPAMDMPELVQQGSPEALQLRMAMQACTCRKFDMSKGPLFHVDVFRVRPGTDTAPTLNLSFKTSASPQSVLSPVHDVDIEHPIAVLTIASTPHTCVERSSSLDCRSDNC